MIVTGLNIREPYASLIATGQKRIETRTYRFPDRLIGEKLAIVATGVGHAKIIGSMVVVDCFPYRDEDHFRSEFKHHLVSRGSQFDWRDGRPKYGWVVTDQTLFREYIEAPTATGMVWRKACPIWTPETIGVGQ